MARAVGMGIQDFGKLIERKKKRKGAGRGAADVTTRGTAVRAAKRIPWLEKERSKKEFGDERCRKREI